MSSKLLCNLFQANHTTPLEELGAKRGNQCVKVFIQRDYSEGTLVKFQTRRPPELEDKVVSISTAFLQLITSLLKIMGLFIFSD